MTIKSLLTASLLVPLIALSGVAYAGGPRTPTAFQNSAQAQNQTGPSVASKPYAQYVAPQQTSTWIYQGGPKSPPRLVGR
jgi:hypothetical protein